MSDVRVRLDKLWNLRLFLALKRLFNSICHDETRRPATTPQLENQNRHPYHHQTETDRHHTNKTMLPQHQLSPSRENQKPKLSIFFVVSRRYEIRTVSRKQGIIILLGNWNRHPIESRNHNSPLWNWNHNRIWSYTLVGLEPPTYKRLPLHLKFKLLVHGHVSFYFRFLFQTETVKK